MLACEAAEAVQLSGRRCSGCGERAEPLGGCAETAPAGCSASSSTKMPSQGSRQSMRVAVAEVGWMTSFEVTHGSTAPLTLVGG